MKHNGKKRIISLVVLTAVASTMLAGCAGGKKSVTGDDVTRVTVWSGESHSKSVYSDYINNWNKTEGKKKGIFIDYQVKDGGSITQALDLALQSGTAPDFFPGAWNLAKLSENGYILPIEELPGGPELVAKYEGKLIEHLSTYAGKTYTLPTSASTQGLLYNKDMFKAAGIVDENGEAKPPKTLDEMVEYAKLLTKPDKKEYGIILPVKWDGWFGSDIHGMLMSNEGFVEYDPAKDEFDCSGYIPIMHAFLDMKENGSVFPGAESIDNDTARAQFGVGNIGMKLGFSFDVGVLNDQFPAKCDWGVAPYPVRNENEKYLQRMTYGSTAAINAASLEKIGGEKLMEVLKFFSDDAFVVEMYKTGMALPYEWDIVKDVELGEGTKKGWKEFAELVSISRYPNSAPKTDRGAYQGIGTIFVNEVWTGDKTPEAICEEYENVLRSGREKYYKDHPDKDPKAFADANWNIRR